MEKAYAFLLKSKVEFELVAVDDSEDGTWPILQQFEREHDHIVVVKGGEPPGYGTALKKGFERASGDILIPFNGDFSDSLEDVMTYIQLIESGYDMVFGSRFMPDSKVHGAPVGKASLSKWGNLFVQWYFGIQCNDVTNSFKAYRRAVWEAVDPAKHDTSLVLELALHSILRKFKYTTIPVSWSGREYGRSKMSIAKVALRYLTLVFDIKKQMVR